VAVGGGDAVSVFDEDEVAVAALGAGEGNGSVVCGVDGVADGSGEVDAVVHLVYLVDGVNSHAIEACDSAGYGAEHVFEDNFGGLGLL